jgi:N-acyl-L-homoserine lactone synthetase
MESVLLAAEAVTARHVPLIEGMYRLRHTVFSERLKWTSLNPDGREVDRFDALNPVYLICRDPSGDVVGCWRLLPTSGPYMLKDIFSHLLGDAAAPEEEDVWEISRFAIDPNLRQYQSLGAVSHIVGHMLIELFDFAERNNIRRIVAASDIRFDRILARSGLRTRHFAPPVAMENSLAVAGWADISEDNRAKIEERLGRSLPALPHEPVPHVIPPLKEISFG